VAIASDAIRSLTNIIKTMKKIILVLVIPLLMPMGIFAQFSILGRITDKTSGTPLSGASISIEGHYAYTTSDANGNYELKNLKAGNYQLKISYVGYTPYNKTVGVPAAANTDIQLERAPVLQDEVIISATRASADQPSTFTNVSKEQISRINHGQDLPYLLNTTPALVTNSDAGNGVGYTSLRIRGSDLTRINVTINGIPLNDAESQGVFWVDMPDLASSIDNVQIQRGIGTSSNGSAAFGASINFQTTKLNPQPYASYDLGYGSFNTWKHTLSASTGLLAKHWAFDLRLSKLNSDGFIERASTDMKSFYFSGGYYGKKTILKTVIFSGKEKTYQAWNGVPKCKLKNDTAAMHILTIDDGWSPDEIQNLYQSDARRFNRFLYKNQTDNYQQDNYQLLFSQEAGQRFLINAALHYTYGRGYYEEYQENDDFSKYGLSYPVIGTDTIRSTNLVRQKWLKNYFYGFTFSGKYDNHKNLQLILGGAGNRYEGDHYGYITWAQYAQDIPIDYQWYDNKSLKTELSIYGKVNYNPVKKITTYLDLQYRTQAFSLKGIDDKLRDITQSHKFGFFNPKLGVNYDINNNHKVYLALAISNREPNGNNYADADPTKPMPVKETMYNVELGYTFRSKFVTTTVNGYYMYYKNQLVLTGAINDVGYPIMTNVPKSYRAGVEISAAAKLFKRFHWEVNAAISQNKIMNFTELVDAFDTDWNPIGQIQNNLGTTNIAFSPSVVASNTFSYNFMENFNISLVSKYVSRQYADNTSSKDRSLDPYCVSNLVLDYTFSTKFIKEITISLSLNNIFNKLYENNAWVYRYKYMDFDRVMDGYFPQAGINFMSGLKIKI
jgi:iron complex outermembrane recepter protein